MRKNWPFRFGMLLFLGQAVVFPVGSPYLLGAVSTASLACLILGLFLYGHGGIGIGQHAFYTMAAVVLILIAGRTLFLVAESLTYDHSADVHVEYTLFGAWGACIAAFFYGLIRKARNPKTA